MPGPRSRKHRSPKRTDLRVGRGLGKEEQGAETRARLVKVARRLFGEMGYVAATTALILEEAGVTRGALYHHFGDKADLMRAVVDEAYADINARVLAVGRAAKDPWSALLAGCDAFLRLAEDPAVVRIVFVDGPSALGVAEWDAIDHKHGLASLREGIEEAIEAGALAPSPAEPLAVLLNGAINAAMFWVVRQPDSKRALGEARKSLRRLLDALGAA